VRTNYPSALHTKKTAIHFRKFTDEKPQLKNYPAFETSYVNGKYLLLLEFPLEITDDKHSRKLKEITVFKNVLWRI